MVKCILIAPVCLSPKILGGLASIDEHFIDSQRRRIRQFIRLYHFIACCICCSRFHQHQIVYTVEGERSIGASKQKDCIHFRLLFAMRSLFCNLLSTNVIEYIELILWICYTSPCFEVYLYSVVSKRTIIQHALQGAHHAHPMHECSIIFPMKSKHMCMLFLGEIKLTHSLHVNRTSLKRY